MEDGLMAFLISSTGRMVREASTWRIVPTGRSVAVVILKRILFINISSRRRE